MDALLDARPARYYQYGFVEASGDFVNKSVDVLGVLDKANVSDGVGNYSGSHLRLGWQLSDRLWIEGSAWQRQVSLGSDKPKIDSYSLASQYRFFDQPFVGSPLPDLAIRGSYWSDRAETVRRNGQLPGADADPLFSLINLIEVANVKDRQQQLDLIASWALRRNVSVSLFAGYGQGFIRIGSLSAGTTPLGPSGGRAYIKNEGCSNQFSVDSARTAAELVEPGEILLTLLKPSLEVSQDLCYEHSYKQLGASAQWLPFEKVSLRAGYLFQMIDRGSLDTRFREAGGKPITEGHTLIGEAAYRFAKFGQIFLRGQLMSGPFLGEIPMLYNRITAPRFDREYGFVSLGLILDF